MNCALKFFIGLCLCIPQTILADAKVGSPAPDFTTIDSNGVTHSLSNFKGKKVVLEWFNNECPYVVKHYDSKNMQALQKKYTAQDIVWLTINSSAPGKQGHVDGAAANALIKEHESAQTAFLLDADGTIGKLYGARTTPHMYIIDEAGVLQYAGAIDSNSSSRQSTIADATNYVTSALNNLAANKAVDPANTEPYGCSVKYPS